MLFNKSCCAHNYQKYRKNQSYWTTEPFIAMKKTTSFNSKNKYSITQASAMNRVCLVIKWKPGFYLLLSCVLLLCVIKMYLNSIASEVVMSEVESDGFQKIVSNHHKISKPTYYGIMIDAGSTGSRVHVYEFHEKSHSAAPFLAKERFEQIKPGLSSYASNPSQGAETIKALLDIAKETVPENQWSTTPVALKATAGLRLLPEEQASNLLNAVRAVLRQYPFKLPKSPVEIMEGSDEGIYGWISVNFLLERLGGDDGAQFSVGCIDLGGGSMQITFAPHEINTTNNLDQTFVSKVPVFNSVVTLYTHSYLGFGLMSAREATMGGPDAQHTVTVSTACMPASFSGHWENGRTKYVINGATGIDQTRYQICRSATDKAVKGRIAHPLEVRHHPFYIFSYFFDRAVDAKLVDAEHGGAMTVQSYVRAAEKLCADELFQPRQPFLCMDLCILSSFLEVGYMFAPDTALITLKTIAGKEATWSLGATFNLISET